MVGVLYQLIDIRARVSYPVHIDFFVSLAAVLLGEVLPLDFEIQGGRDESLVDGVTGIVIKEIKGGSILQKYNVKVGDHILKVQAD